MSTRAYSSARLPLVIRWACRQEWKITLLSYLEMEEIILSVGVVMLCHLNYGIRPELKYISLVHINEQYLLLGI